MEGMLKNGMAPALDGIKVIDLTQFERTLLHRSARLDGSESGKGRKAETG